MRANSILIAAFIVSFGTQSQAACFGSDSFKTCTDSSGNTYNVTKFGNTTTVNGTNARGESWNSTSQTYGNTTYQRGTSKDGGNWNQTITNMGGGTTYRSGTDSDGNSFSQTCNQYGCY